MEKAEDTGSILYSRKTYQRNKILNAIRTNEDVSKADLKNLTGYSMTTVIGIVEELLDNGWIYEEECVDPRRGRKPVWLRLRPDGGYFIGLEFNRNAMCCVVLNFRFEQEYVDARVIEERQKNRDEIILLMQEMIKKAIDAIGERKKKIIGIGLGVPGYIDKKSGTTLSYNHLKNWEHVPLRKIIEDTFGIPCYMEKNTNVMVYAYKWLVSHGRCEDMLFISIRTGVCMIPVINNQISGSAYGYAGEIGHIRVHNGSRFCECGRTGCLNSEISDVAIVNKIISGIRIGRYKEIARMTGEDTDKVTMDIFLQSVQEKHPDSLRLLHQCAEYLGEMIAVLVNIYAPVRVVIYGRLASIGEPFIRIVREAAAKDSIKDNYARLSIRVSPFREELGAMGAALLVMQETFPFVEETL